MQALVPMVDLFAVLAIVFMIHSNEEITAAQTEVQEARYALEAIDDAERTRRERRELMANEATKSLEQIQEERARQAEELLAQFTEMLAAQQSSTDTEYANILVLCSQSLFRFADLGDDGLCRGGPDKGCGVIVSAIDVVVDRLD